MKNFLIKLNKLKKKKEIFINEKKINKKICFYYGYILKKKKYDQGEFLKFKYDKKKIIIENDIFGSYPLYIYEDKIQYIISTSIHAIFKVKKSQNFLDFDALMEYFSWGYLPCTNKTIYKNIKTLEPNSILKITNQLKIKNLKNKIFFKKKINFQSLLKSIKNELKHYSNLTNLKKSYGGLTSGYDSLLGIQLLNSVGIKFDLATFGDHNSSEQKISNFRNKKIFKQIHNQIYIQNILPSKKDFFKISILLGGLSTFACFHIFNFHYLFKKKIKKNFFDFSMMEFFRRYSLNEENIIKKYTTPESVVKRYFFNKNKITESIKESIKRMKKKYKKNLFNYFYILDRASKNQFYKTVFLNELDMTKVAIAHNKNILNNVTNYINQHKDLPYIKILKSFKINLLVNEYKKLIKNKNKNWSHDYIQYCYRFKKNFVEIIQKDKSNLCKLFNYKKIIDNLKNESLQEKDQWFILRLINLLIFIKKNKIILKI